jgi:hypothetical protein
MRLFRCAMTAIVETRLLAVDHFHRGIVGPSRSERSGSGVPRLTARSKVVPSHRFSLVAARVAMRRYAAAAARHVCEPVG